MAAVLARGGTETLNAARDAEIGDLALCLSAMGPHRSRRNATQCGARPTPPPGPSRSDSDRIEAGTYEIAAAITGGELEILGAHLEHLGAVSSGPGNAGVQIWPTDRGLMIVRSGPLRAVDLDD